MMLLQLKMVLNAPDSIEMVPVADDSVTKGKNEFISPTFLSDEHYKEILEYDNNEYLIFGNSGKSGFSFVMPS